MEIKLKDAPDILFDQQIWRDFCEQFASKESALAAISRPPWRRYGYHADEDRALPTTERARINHAQKTFELGKQLVGAFKNLLISEELTATGIIFHLVYQEGEFDPVQIPAEKWRSLWPEFNDSRAMGDGRYEDVRIHWDDRKKPRRSAFERKLVSWLRDQKPRQALKKQLAQEARERFGPAVSVRLFNRAYETVFQRKRGRPRTKK